GPVVGKERLRHEGDGLVVLLCDVANDVFVILHRIAHHFEGRETDVDLCLAGRGYFVMLFVDWNTCFLELERHLVADVLQGVHRWNRKISLLRSNLVTEIRKFLSRAVPMAFDAVNEMERGVGRVAKAHFVEDKKLSFGSEERGIGDAGAL